MYVEDWDEVRDKLPLGLESFDPLSSESDGRTMAELGTMVLLVSVNLSSNF